MNESFDFSDAYGTITYYKHKLLRRCGMPKVFVGMSGGVDSSSAALMLREQGYDVEGVTLRLKPGSLADEDIRDAAAAADSADIKLHVLDLRELFREKVIGYFTSEYLRGATPNPCVICNREIKFGAMLDYALKNGADYVATGHYASLERRDGQTLLRRSASSKDQSYFLCMLSQFQLSHALFPLDGMEKSEIREFARARGLSTASKKDSQEVCFIPDNDYSGFIRSQGLSDMGEGDFVDINGSVIGRHKGIMNYTVGQRKGLGAFGRPMFVTRLDIGRNRVVLGEEGAQYSDGFFAGDINWISGEIPKNGFRAQVKIRFRAPAAWATVTPEDKGLDVKFDEPQRSVTPGQFAAFYDGDTVLGGGHISLK